MAESFVDKEICTERYGNTVKRLDKHSGQIDDLKDAVIVLKEILRQQEQREQKEDKKPALSFWQTKWFEWIVKTVCIIAIVVVMAAIGVNYFEKYLSVLGG